MIFALASQFHVYLSCLEAKCFQLPGVPQYCFHFVFVIFSGSGARTEELLTFIQQPFKFAT